MFDFIIIGAGLSGSIFARKAAEQNKKVLIIEKRDHIGGNCYDYKDKNTDILIHKYGPHLFHTNNKEVFEFLSSFTHWDFYEHKTLGHILNKKIPIPFNLNSLYKLFDLEKAIFLEKKLKEEFVKEKITILELLSSSNKDISELGLFIFENVFKNYTIKQWGLKPEEIDSSILERVPVLINKDDRYFQDTYQFVPKEGYTKMIENILNHKNITTILETDFKNHISLNESEIFYQKEIFKGKLIFTGEIDNLFNYIYGDLPYRSLQFKQETLSMNFFQETTIENYPNTEDYTRITEYKHIQNLGKKDKTIIIKEYPIPYEKNKNLPFYPILTKDNQELYKKYEYKAKKYKNLYLLGRLAEYKYYNMDQIIEKTISLSKELL